MVIFLQSKTRYAKITNCWEKAYYVHTSLENIQIKSRPSCSFVISIGCFLLNEARPHTNSAVGKTCFCLFFENLLVRFRSVLSVTLYIFFSLSLPFSLYSLYPFIYRWLLTAQTILLFLRPLIRVVNMEKRIMTNDFNNDGSICNWPNLLSQLSICFIIRERKQKFGG